MLTGAMQDAVQETWLTFAEAAAVLGCSPDTARRRVRRGELVATHQGRQVRVPLDSLPGSVHSNGTVQGNVPGSAVQDQNEGILEALRLIDRLQRAGLVGSLQERNANLEARLGSGRGPS